MSSKFVMLHIPTGHILQNKFHHRPWYFTEYGIMYQFIDPKCSINLIRGPASIKYMNPEIDWKNVLLTEFEVVELPDDTNIN